MGVVLLLVSLWESFEPTLLCGLKSLWRSEFIIEFVLVDGGYGCDGLRGLSLVPFVVPY